MAQAPNTSYSNIPIPDPTEITAREIAKVKAELKQDFISEITHLKESLNVARQLKQDAVNARLDAMEKATALLHENASRFPTILDKETVNIRALFEEKLNGILTRFDGIAVQFRERDIRTDQDKIAASTAVNAALQAQKEAAGAQNESNAAAITKSENSFTKEIDGLKALIATTKDSTNSQVQNLTGRMDRGEGGAQGAHQNMGTILSMAAVAISVLAIIASLYLGSHSNGGGGQPSALAVAPLNPSAVAPR
jgi:hypothetical protein